MNNRVLILVVILIIIAGSLYYFAKDKEWFKEKETETNINENTIKEVEFSKAEAMARSIIGSLEREYNILSRTGELVDKEYFIENGEFVDEELRGPVRQLEKGKLIITSDGRNAFVVIYEGYCVTKGLDATEAKVVEHEDICMHEDLPEYEVTNMIEND